MKSTDDIKVSNPRYGEGSASDVAKVVFRNVHGESSRKCDAKERGKATEGGQRATVTRRRSS